MPPPSKPGRPAGTLNTLRMAPAELDALIDEFDSMSHGSAPKRQHARLDFRRDSLLIEFQQPGGTSKLNYACRDLSASGASILHSSYIHIGTPCFIHIPKTDGTTVPVAGKVMRCRFIKGKVHEVGIKFDVVICVHEFVELNPLEGQFSLEAVNSTELTGSILHAAPAEIDRKLVRLFADGTGLSVTTANSGTSALQRATERFDLIISALELGDMRADGLANGLVKAGIRTPLMLLTDRASTDATETAKKACASAMLCKPLDREKVLRAIAEILGNSSGSGPAGAILSAIPIGDSRECLLSEAVDEINRLSNELRACTDFTHADTARGILSKLRSTARSMEFVSIAAAADSVIAAIPNSSESPWPTRQLRELSELGTRARGRTNQPAASPSATPAPPKPWAA